MKRALKKRWVAALQNGHYKQGQGELMTGKKQEFCCLGVLCNILDPYGWEHSPSGATQWYLRSAPEIAAPSGILGKKMLGYVGLTQGQQERLVEMNDALDAERPASFREIAAWIQENL